MNQLRILVLTLILAIVPICRGAVPSLGDFDSTYFRTSSLPVSLVGTLTNWAKLSTNVAGVSWWTNYTGDIDGNGTVTNWIASPTNKTVYVGNDWSELNPDLQQEGIGSTLVVAKKSSGGGVAAVSLSVDDPNSESAGLIIEDAWTDDGGGSRLRNSLYVQSFHHDNVGRSSVVFNAGQILTSGYFDPLQSATNSPMAYLVGVTGNPGTYNPYGAGTLSGVNWSIGFLAFQPWNDNPQTVTNSAGLYVTSSGAFDSIGLGPLAKIANAYGVYVEDLSAAGTNTYAFYSAGTSPIHTAGIVESTGISSTATDSLLAFTATGRTNTLGKVGVARFDGTNVIYVVKNNAGSTVYTNSVAVGRVTEIVQNGGAIVVTSGTVVGTMSPF